MKTSESINEVCAALSAAQGAFSNPARNRTVKVKTRDGGTYEFAYATLDAIMDMVRAPLAKNGLSIAHSLEEDDKGTVCETRLSHTSGQWLSTWVPVIVAEGADAQKWGSAITYARRYGVTTLLGIAADEDDDANHASGNFAQRAAPRSTAAATKPAPKAEPPKAAPPTTHSYDPRAVSKKLWSELLEANKGKLLGAIYTYIGEHADKPDDLLATLDDAVARQIPRPDVEKLAAAIGNLNKDEQLASTMVMRMTEAKA